MFSAHAAVQAGSSCEYREEQGSVVSRPMDHLVTMLDGFRLNATTPGSEMIEPGPITGGGILARHIARGDTDETATERRVREAIQRHSGADDVVISGLRLHDNTYGDVKVDLLVLMPNAGVGIVEVKGGTITFADGTWYKTGKEGTKEIDLKDVLYTALSRALDLAVIVGQRDQLEAVLGRSTCDAWKAAKHET